MTEKSVDWKELLKLANSKTELAEELLDMFAKQLPEHRQIINNTHKENNMTEFQKEVHKLHGSCCYAGAPQLKKLTGELEELSKSSNQAAINKVLQQLNKEVDNVLNIIKKRSYA